MDPDAWDGNLPAVSTISDEAAVELSKFSRWLVMPGLTSISDNAAETLGRRVTGNLPKLTSLSPAVVNALGRDTANNSRHLQLDAVTTISDEAAAQFSVKTNNRYPASRWGLSLNSLKTLTPAAARSMIRRKGDLSLNGLTRISDEALKALVEDQSVNHVAPLGPFVHLEGLTEISDESAAMLTAWPKWSGRIPALKSLSEKGAAALASSRNWDGKLPALEAVSVETAAALARRDGDLALDGLRSLSDEVATALARHQGGMLTLNGLTSISESAAEILARHQGGLALDGLPELTPRVAQALARYQAVPGKVTWDRVDWLHLDGVTSLSDEAAKAIAERPGVVSLSGLKTASPNAIKILLANSSIALPETGPLSRAEQTDLDTRPATDQNFVRSFLSSHCADCHDDGADEGNFELARLTKDNIASRVAYAAIFERLRAGDMPPPDESRPDAADVDKVVGWIAAKLDTPLPEPPRYYAVSEIPSDGNLLPHAILFGGPRGPSVPPPPRLWRLSPGAYSGWADKFKAGKLLKPFGLILDMGIKDYADLYAPDEGATQLLLVNAELIIEAQTEEAANGPLAPLLLPKVKATHGQLEEALRYQYRMATARLPSDAELKSLIALYEDLASDGDLELAGRSVLLPPLMVPDAILRFEIGQGAQVRPGVRMLSPGESVQALSLAISTMPIPSLKESAAAGKLNTREDVARAVEQALSDPEVGKSQVLQFFREFFDYGFAPEVFKDPWPRQERHWRGRYNPGGYVSNTDYLVVDILGRDKDVLKELLTTRAEYSTGSHFNVRDAFDDHQPSPIFRHVSSLAAETRQTRTDHRIGIPMQRSWQIAWSQNFHNDIVLRGHFIRTRFLGGKVPGLPINAAAMIPDDPHHTLRQRQMVTRDAKCWKCHYKMDELGLPFEDVDHYGFVLETERVLDLKAMEKSGNKDQKIFRDRPLDTTGRISYSGDPWLDGPVRDAPEMLRRLARSDRVRQVFIRHAFRYFLGRNETPGDAVTLQEADKAYLDNGGSFKALLVSLLSSESFLYRTMPTDPERIGVSRQSVGESNTEKTLTGG
jgi:mono/diheme cytochrome c family protein